MEEDQRLVSSAELNVKFILEKGVILALVSMLIHALFYFTDLFYNMWAAILNGLLAIGISITLLVIFIKALKKMHERPMKFMDVFKYTLLMSIASVVVYSAYEIVFYQFVEPNFDLIILNKMAESMTETFTNLGMSDADIEKSTEQFYTQIEAMEKNPPGIFSRFGGRLTNGTIFGAIIGGILGLIFKDDPDEFEAVDEEFEK